MPARPTQVERLILSNQLKILAALYPDEADDFSIVRTALEAGYELQCEDYLESIRVNGMSIQETQEAWDTLEMFHSLRLSAEALDRLDWLEEQGCDKFPGYDGNDAIEGRFMWFVEYTVTKLNRFEYVEIDDFNSHWPKIDGYRRMLTIWRKVPAQSRSSLSQELLEQIVRLK